MPFIFIYFLLIFFFFFFVFVDVSGTVCYIGWSFFIYDDYVTCDTITRVYLLSMCGRVKLHKNREDLLPKMALSSFLFLEGGLFLFPPLTLSISIKACLDCICIRNELPS